MPTRPLSEIAQARIAHDPEAITALLREAIDAMLRGELDVGRPLLRDYSSKARLVLNIWQKKPARRLPA